ncbi:hypothetical protein [Actinomadura sp. NTSP31]|uniref:hypothetical protein n=1 Tax=Actinomadura sp. NTSP31 TaxID=1735447 RepID=UPI0035BFA3F6
MNDELEALLRDHYRAAADHITAGPGTVRRFQEAGRAAPPPERGRWRWAFPALAAAVTAAVLVTIAVFLWPGGGTPAKPHPMGPPASPSLPAPGVPVPGPTDAPEARPSPSRPPESGIPPQIRSDPGVTRRPQDRLGPATPTPSPTGAASDRPVPTSKEPAPTPTRS